MENQSHDPTQNPEADDINSIKIKNIENIVSSYNDRFELINKLFIKTKSFMEEVITSVLTKKVENIEDDIRKIIKIIDGHTEELKTFESKFRDIFKNPSDMTIINNTIKMIGDDIADSRERLTNAVNGLSEITNKNKVNESSIADLTKSLTELNSKIKIISDDNEPVVSSIKAGKMVVSFIKIMAAISVAIFAIIKSLIYLKKEGIFNLLDIFKLFC